MGMGVVCPAWVQGLISFAGGLPHRAAWPRSPARRGPRGTCRCRPGAGPLPPYLVGAPSKTWRAGQWPPTPYLGAAPPRSPMGCAGPGPPVVSRSTASRAHPRRVPGTGRSFEAAARRPSGRSVLPPMAAGEFAFKGAAPWAWDPRGPLAPHGGCAGRCVTSPPASKRVGSNRPGV